MDRTDPKQSQSALRPTGITLIALLAGVSGFLGLCGALPVFGISALVGLIPTAVTAALGLVGVVISILLIAGPLLQFAFAYGAWNLRPWAWWLGVVGTGVSVLGTLISILSGIGIVTAIFHGLLPIVIFVYLLLPGTRAAFRQGQRPG